MKYYGTIGYNVTEETAPGVWTNQVVTRNYFGDILRNSRRLEGSGKVNDNIAFSGSISIIADPYAFQNFQNMLYATIFDQKWKITDVEVQYPRLQLTIGGVYNGESD